MKPKSNLDKIRGTGLAIAFVVASLLYVSTLRAQPLSTDILNSVRLDQRLGETVPGDVHFLDEKGNDVALGDFWGDHPVVLVPVFYRCRMLCTQILSALVRNTAGQTFDPGQDFTVVVFSIDPRETPQLALEKKLEYLKRLPRPSARHGWHFLVGSQPSIRRVTDAIGYRYSYDKKRDQFAHPAAVAVLTPRGVVSRYLFGLDYKPRDLHLAVLEASNGSIGGVVDQILLRCYCYNPESGRYGFAVMTALRVGGALTVAVLAAGILVMSRRRKRNEAQGASTAP